MTVSRVKLLGREEIASGTMAFYFEKPKGFLYKAGQFADFTLIDPPETDVEGNIRGFSIASAPYEDDLMVATRMRDTAFKRSLKRLPLGTELSLDAPYGSLTLHSDAHIPAVFLSGGIGVTPARSIILQATHDKLAHEIVLIDSNHTPNDAAFLGDLTEAARRNPKFKLVCTMTDVDKSPTNWKGQTGFVTKEMLAGAVADLSRPIFYITGPAMMVAAMEEILEEAGVADDRVHTEEFTGY